MANNDLTICEKPAERVVPGFPAYKVAEDGRIISGFSGRTLKTCIRGGYLYVTLCNGSGAKKKAFVHRLVALLFHGNPNGLPEVNHIDGNKLNNAAANLEWVDRSGNQRHAHATGLQKTGEASRMCIKLTARDVRRIRAMRGQMSQAKIGALFGVSQTYVGKLHRNLKWKY